MEFLKHNHIWHYLLTFALAIALVVPSLFSDGMFMDGQQYSCVAKNMADGVGSFWFPVFTEVGVGDNSSFHEQPPLMFGIQALFFKVLGNGFATERIYGLVVFAISIFLILRIYDRLFKNNFVQNRFSSLAVLLWVVVPVVNWSFANGVVEITMGIFILASFLFIFRGITEKRKSYLFLMIGGVFIFLASLTKGLPGIFTLSVPFWYWIVFRKSSFTKMLLNTFYLIGIVALCYALIFLIPNAAESLYIHWVDRFLVRVNANPIVDSRFALLISLFTELLPLIIPGILAIVYLIISKKSQLVRNEIKPSLFLLLIGLSGSLPLMLTLLQRNFYFICAIPFFALALAVLLEPIITKQLQLVRTKINNKVINILAIVLLCSSIGISMSFYHKPLRDKEILHDVYVIGDTFGSDIKFNSTGEVIFVDWAFRSYLLRYYNIELVNNRPVEYYIVKKNYEMNSKIFVKLDCELYIYEIYKRI